jgi:hypothetical protein
LHDDVEAFGVQNSILLCRYRDLRPGVYGRRT